ncbi:MAG: YceH family protein [Acidobacteria bacterium]|nr:YceH family protein [Acidobacteriota bacterium]
MTSEFNRTSRFGPSAVFEIAAGLGIESAGGRSHGTGEETSLKDVILDEVEVRVLGSLMEKQITTPEYYPMSLNALTNACNQKTSRDPVVSYDDGMVAGALERLREKGYTQIVRSTDYRVPKYQQAFNQAFNFAPQEVAVLCVLMLRGSQTPGEIRGRAAPLFRFDELDEVESTLHRLMTRVPQSLVTRLPRVTGMKECRYRHLLSGESNTAEANGTPMAEPAKQFAASERDRVGHLQIEVELLRREVEELKEQFEAFKKQFD